MSENYYGFKKFCSLLSDNNVLKKHSVMGVVRMLQICINEIKKETLKVLIEIDEKKKDYYLDLKIHEIRNQDYLKNYGEDKIYHILKDLDVSLGELIAINYPYELNEKIDKILDFDDYDENFEYLRKTQDGLLLYFLNYYANELISFLESKKTKSTQNVQNMKPNNEISKSVTIVKELGKTYIDFIKLNKKMDAEILLQYGNDPWADHTTIELKYEDAVKGYQQEIKTHLDDLYYSSNKDGFFYFDCSTKVYEQHYEQRKESYLQKIIDSTEEDFIASEVKYLTTPYLNRVIKFSEIDSMYYNSYINYEDKYRIPLIKKLKYLDVRLVPYHKAIIIKENQLLQNENGNDVCYGTDAEIVNVKKSKTEIHNNNNSDTDLKTSKQLTTNQIVLLLQEVGFFTHPKIEKATKEKQSELISKICGLNSKNIKTHIQKLDKKPSELGDNYQKDIDKIDDILNNLE